MSGYLVSTLSIITVLAFLDILVSKTRNGRAVKTVISLITTFMLVLPVVSILKGEGFSNEVLDSNSFYDEYLVELEEKTVLSSIKFALNKGEFDFIDVATEYSTEKDEKYLKKIIIKLENKVISGSDEHINMLKEAKKLLENTVDLNEVEIEIEAD